MYATSLMMFSPLISLPHFKSINFYQNRPKIKLFLQKNTKFLSAGLRPHTPRTAPLQISGSESNHVFAPFYATRILPDATF